MCAKCHINWMNCVESRLEREGGVQLIQYKALNPIWQRRIRLLDLHVFQAWFPCGKILYSVYMKVQEIHVCDRSIVLNTELQNLSYKLIRDSYNK